MNLYVLMPLLAGALNIALAFLVFQRQRQSTYGRVFFILLLSMAGWGISIYAMRSSQTLSQAYDRERWTLVALAAISILYFHFALAFTRRRIGAWPLFLAYAVVICSALAAWSGRVVSHMQVVDYGYAPVFRPLGMVYMGVLYSYVLCALVLVVNLVRTSPSAEERNRARYIAVGASFAILGTITDALRGLGFTLLPMGIIGNIFFALFTTVAIIKYQLVDIKVVVRRGLAYFVLGVFLATLYLVVLFLLQLALYSWAGYPIVAVAIGAAFGLAMTFDLLRSRTQHWVDRLFYGETYDYREMLHSFGRRMSTVLDMEELAENMLWPIIKAVRATEARLLLPDSETGEFTTRFVRRNPTSGLASDLALGRDNPIVSWLTQRSQILSRDLIDIRPEFRSLWREEKERLESLGLELFFPVKRKGSLVGILTVGRKQMGTGYSTEDIELLTTVASEAALVIENARVIDTLREQQLRVEQLLNWTVQAQEDERKRISVELHDSVAQWLVGASYRLQNCVLMLERQGRQEVRGELEEIEKTIDLSIKELRRLMSGLHPPSLPESGLVHTLPQTMERLRAEGVDCHFEVTGEPQRLPSGVEVAILRIVQEALINVRKHAQASEVRLRLEFGTQNINVNIYDNGKGFDLSRTLAGAVEVGHMGILGMKERAVMLGGTLHIGTRQGGGTNIALTLPVPPSVESKIGGEQADAKL